MASAVLIVLAILPYALVIAGIGDLHAVDGITRGLAAVYAIGAAIVVWILLAALLILGGVRGQMPAWSVVTAYILHPCSGLSAIASIVALSQLDPPRLLLSVPVLLPPLIAAYAFWTRIRGVQELVVLDRRRLGDLVHGGNPLDRAMVGHCRAGGRAQCSSETADPLSTPRRSGKRKPGGTLLGSIT